MELNEFLEKTSSDEDKVIKELVDISKNLIAKTELTHEQIVEVCKLKHIARKYKLNNLNLFIEDFMQGKISEARKGRREFIEAIQAQRENKEQLGLFGNLRNNALK